MVLLATLEFLLNKADSLEPLLWKAILAKGQYYAHSSRCQIIFRPFFLLLAFQVFSHKKDEAMVELPSVLSLYYSSQH